MAAKTLKSSATKSNDNCLLAALGQLEFAYLQPRIERVPLVQRDIIAEPGKRTEYVYFPENGFISLVQPMADKSMVEVGIVGREGFAGSHVLLGADASPIMAMVQAPGSAWRMRANVLLEAADRHPKFKSLLLRYVQALHVQIAQTAGCNSRHTLPQRLARWLLTAHDRVGGELALSHEFLAIMLGMRRAGVTVAVGALNKAGLIDNAHARISILNRRGLEAASCECYRAVRKEYKRLLS